MIPKKERFSTADLSKLKSLKSKRINSSLGFFIVYESDKSKKGIMMSKKVFKTAVMRNKYKRLFFNSIKEVSELKNKSLIFHPKKIFNKEELMSAFTFI